MNTSPKHKRVTPQPAFDEFARQPGIHSLALRACIHSPDRTQKLRCLVAILCLAVPVPVLAESDDLNTQLMLATFKLTNPKSTGTAFILSRPTGDAARPRQSILITAEHVLSKMEGDEATLLLRKKDDDDGYSKSPLKLKVRQDGKSLWTRHPALDVAALPISLPGDVSCATLSIDLLASDDLLKKYEVHPGDGLNCIGYPHPIQFEANDAGFPIARMGCLASFPLLPTKKTQTFLLDFNTFEGHSGGPVYLCEHNRFYSGKAQEGRVQLILGLVSGQHFLNEEYKMIYQTGTFRHRLGLAIIVHASAIRETIELLPPP